MINTSDNRLKNDQDGDTITDYEYDKAGNVTLDAENRRFVFDAENKMKEFFHSENTTNTPDAVYQYDGEGRRVRKVSGNRQTIFVYNSSGALIAEYDSQLATNPQVSYLSADHLGSPRVITDGRGAVISRHDYMAFGSEITKSIGNVGGRTTAQGYNSADEVRKQYTGYERDDESGLDFAQARYYNSNHGRFTSVDPLTASASIRNPQTFNRYSYVLNSPYKFVDPLGLIAENAGSACGNRCKNSDGGSGGGFVGLYSDAGQTIGIGRRTEGAGPIAQSAEHPPDQGSQGAQGQDDPVWLRGLREAYPELRGNDRNAALGAILDSRDSVNSTYSTILTGQFRNNSASPTPQQAVAELEIGSIEVIKDKQTGDVVEANIKGNVFDGRTSTLSIDHDNNGNTPDITVAEYFEQNPQTRAITFTRDGQSSIFLGSGFFDQDRAGKAKTMIHEGVVHRGFGRRDADFDPQRQNRQHEGSLEINRKINQFFRLKEPVIIDR